MRDDDKRQLVAADRTVLNSRYGDIAEVDLARRLGTGIPHRSLEGRTFGVRGHLDEAETGSLCERRRETKGDHDKEFGGVREGRQHGSRRPLL